MQQTFILSSSSLWSPPFLFWPSPPSGPLFPTSSSLTLDPPTPLASPFLPSLPPSSLPLLLPTSTPPWSSPSLTPPFPHPLTLSPPQGVAVHPATPWVLQEGQQNVTTKKTERPCQQDSFRTIPTSIYRSGNGRS